MTTLTLAPTLSELFFHDAVRKCTISRTTQVGRTDPESAVRRPSILIADDDEIVRSLLGELFRSLGYRVVEAPDGASTLRCVKQRVDLVLLDYKLPDVDGLSVLRKIRAAHPEVIVIIITAHSSVESAVDAMKIGAYHYLNKPLNLEAVELLVKRAIEARALRDEVVRLRSDAHAHACIEDLVGKSRTMVDVRKSLAKIAAHRPTTVLLRGEAGTGKDLCARILHDGSRSGSPLVVLRCATIAPEAVDGEIFGRAGSERAGLLELATGGSLYIDEVATLPLPVQAALLRALEAKSFRRLGGSTRLPLDACVIASTRRDLAHEAERGAFRGDLGRRLQRVAVTLPPLRARRGDVALLAEHFTDLACTELGRRPAAPTPEALQALEEHPWPGNVRELRNSIERALILEDKDTLGREAFVLQRGGRRADRVELPDGGIDILQHERSLVLLALEKSRGNQTRAAALLGLNRFQVRSRIRKYGLGVAGAQRRVGLDRR
ncbi:MAG: sigma-54 dependent transcriptional regulator [Acidobacteriota bacterium]